MNNHFWNGFFFQLISDKWSISIDGEVGIQSVGHLTDIIYLEYTTIPHVRDVYKEGLQFTQFDVVGIVVEILDVDGILRLKQKGELIILP